MSEQPRGAPGTPSDDALATVPETEASAAARTDDTDPVLAELKREHTELYDRLLRATAEFDNYRKRTERERRETSERVTAALLEDLLPIVDDLERALKAEAGPGAEAYRTGIEIIYRQLQDLLARRGATPIPAVGTDFDPHVHQAVAYDESPGHRDGEVLEELRRGYKLGDRLLRPAMVRVAKA